MTRDDIIKWAKDCLLLDFRDNPTTDSAVAQFVGTLEDFAALVAAAEREECAKVCEVKAHSWPYPSHGNAAAKLCAQEIRARAIEREILGGGE